MKLPPGFLYDRLPPPAWQEQLATIAPKGEIAPWLLLAWLPGDPWDTSILPDGTTQIGVQRWCVYEMVPLRIWQGLIQAHRVRGFKPEETLEQLILDGLMGPNPRDLGHYDEVLKRYITDADVTRQEWELFRAHRAVPKLFWIVQGVHGGHRRHYTPMEKKYLQLAQLPAEPPAPGALPYADFDNRALALIRRRDRLQRQQGFLGKDEDEYSAAMVEFRRQLVQWLEDQQRQNLESAKLDLSDLPRSGDAADDPTEAIERRTERFIQTGSIYPKAKE